MSRVLNQLEQSVYGFDSSNPIEGKSYVHLVPEENLERPRFIIFSPGDSKLKKLIFSITIMMLVFLFFCAAHLLNSPKKSTSSQLATSLDEGGVEMIALNRKAIQSFYSRDLDNAYSSLRYLTERYGENAAFSANLGVVLHAQGKKDEAIAAFEKALDEKALGGSGAPNHDPMTFLSARITALNGLGVIKMESSDFDSAISLFTRALQVSSQAGNVALPASEAVFLNLGKLSELRGQWKAAASYYSRFLNSTAAGPATREMIANRLKRIEQGMR